MRRPTEEQTIVRGEGPPEPPPSLLRRWWAWYVVDNRAEADAVALSYLATTPSRVANRKAGLVLFTAAVVLTTINYAGDPRWLITLVSSAGLKGTATTLEGWLLASPYAGFNGLIFWALIQVGSYVGFPLIVIRLFLRDRIGSFGLEWRGVWRKGGVYLLLFAASVPFIVFASTTADFRERYPFYDLAPGEGLWPRMALWWLAYASQFVALEFFFRGFMVHGLKQRLGYMAIFAMIVPYNMLHYQKPVLEAVAAIGGGFVLGSMSLRTRSIWWGAALHIMVAGSMDVLALLEKGLL